MFNFESTMAQIPSDTIISSPSVIELAWTFTNSTSVGIIMSLVTMWAMQKLPSGPLKAKNALANSEDATNLIIYQQLEARLNAATVLFLCVGMTGVMMLVSNSLARAFAVGAAIAMVRFRVRLDKPGLSTAIFFSVLIGMACGTDHITMAWALTMIFSVLQVCVILLSLSGMKADQAAADHKASLVPNQKTTPFAYNTSSANGIQLDTLQVKTHQLL